MFFILTILTSDLHVSRRIHFSSDWGKVYRSLLRTDYREETLIRRLQISDNLRQARSKISFSVAWWLGSPVVYRTLMILWYRRLNLFSFVFFVWWFTRCVLFGTYRVGGSCFVAFVACRAARARTARPQGTTRATGTTKINNNNNHNSNTNDNNNTVTTITTTLIITT